MGWGRSQTNAAPAAGIGGLSERRRGRRGRRGNILIATWAAYHLIHARVPRQRIPKLLIAQAPDDEEVTRDLLERAGFIFGEFGIPWANHYIEKLGPRATWWGGPGTPGRPGSPGHAWWPEPARRWKDRGGQGDPRPHESPRSHERRKP